MPWPQRAYGGPSLMMLLAGLYVVLLPYQFEIVRGLNFAPADCFLVLLLLCTAGGLYYRKQTWSVWHLGLILTFAMGSLVASVRFGKLTRYEFLNKDLGLFLPFLSYAAITSLVTSWEAVRKVIRILVLGVTAENLFAVGSYLAAYFWNIQSPFTRYGGLRLSGSLLDPNAYGGLLVTAFVLLEVSSHGPRPLFRTWLLWVGRATLLLGIVFTFSRSAWISLGAAFLVIFLFRPRIAVGMLWLVIAGTPCLVLLLGARFVSIFQEMASRPQQIDQRFYLIDAAFHAFYNHPFIGGGLGSFRLSMGEVAHNTAMWFLADFGIVGLVAVLGFLGWFFAIAGLAYQAAPAVEKPIALALLAAHAAMLGLAMGIEAFYQRQWWVVLALIAAAYSLTTRLAGRTGCATEVIPHVET
jgi:putative inorganic carbon (HCO3(-)) transporter